MSGLRVRLEFLGGPGNADQVAFGVGEVPDDEARRCSLRAHPAGAAQLLGLLQGGLDIGNCDVEQYVGVVSATAANTAGDAGAVAGCDAGDEAVVVRLGHRFGDRGADVEIPSE